MNSFSSRSSELWYYDLLGRVYFQAAYNHKFTVLCLKPQSFFETKEHKQQKLVVKYLISKERERERE